MNWSLNCASIIGRDHELSKKNRQDFTHSFISTECIVGTVCDGCGESKYSEVGASLMSLMIVNYLRHFQTCLFHESFKKRLEEEFACCFKAIERAVYIDYSQTSEKVGFVKDFLLSTCLFCVLLEDKIVVGNCGDGVIIIDDKINNIDQSGKPEYIAYKSVPKEALDTPSTELDFFNIQIFEQSNVNRIIIGTDGIQPLVDKGLTSQLYNTQKRKLQRKFNVWQNEGLFADDATCIVIEKQNVD